jgi:hypothetical protein
MSRTMLVRLGTGWLGYISLSLITLRHFFVTACTLQHIKYVTLKYENGGDESVVKNCPLVLHKFSFDLLEFIIFVL